jgi:hypothetical protein
MKFLNDFSELEGALVFNVWQSSFTENMSPQFKSVPKFRGFKFSVHATEMTHGGKLEPKHVHVDTHGQGKVKFWLEYNGNQVEVAKNEGVPSPIVNDIQTFIKDNRPAFIHDWNVLFNETGDAQ